ncbi:hypothetical protein P154DRAFT_516481 [Amniculicola lignicola CBS 123094]|uniref:Uncharacterized protein n=1 Tax=Amniculicola lignicola CBS 123094 TaxID=1392246 RepID=A0A6A5X461_9PLEO|nr:hypothetical protein P154DRAFT_516481 [Amniculicola lignicola CBS 123094]
MQSQYSQQYNMPLAQGGIATNPSIPPQPTYAGTPLVQSEPNEPFAHINNIPLFSIYSINEVALIRKAIEQNAETNELRQEFLKNIPPPLSAGDALTAKLVTQYIAAMSDGGTTLILSQFTLDKMAANALGALDAMERKMMVDNQWLVYSRWATPSDFAGPRVIVDVLLHHSYSDRAKMRGIQFKTNTTAKFKIFGQWDISVKEGKEWNKTWFRGRYHKFDVSMLMKDGAEVKMGQVVSVERGVSPNLASDLITRWQKFTVPKGL